MQKSQTASAASSRVLVKKWHRELSAEELFAKNANTSLLSLNVDKSKFITFSSTVVGQPIQNSLESHDGDCELQHNCPCQSVIRVELIRYLGVEVDQHLRWENYASKLALKLRALSGRFNRLSDVLNEINLIITMRIANYNTTVPVSR
ncbi:hypothetical protein HHI36_017145 [Cryptolaemus montrouzieri]|uniref:Uncharacterized protein n=1 Tax=Cryptolaemus montrouzieri TaxID=559131 RepID=A0ABD2NLX4_9CUCU